MILLVGLVLARSVFSIPTANLLSMFQASHDPGLDLTTGIRKHDDLGKREFLSLYITLYFVLHENSIYLLQDQYSVTFYSLVPQQMDTWHYPSGT